MAKIVDLDHKWATLIGRVFISFGSIERLTHESLKKWLKDPIYSHIKNMRFSARVDLLIDIVTEQGFQDENVAPFINNLKLSKEMAKKRNLIAHNPLMLCLFQEEPDFTEAIVSSVKNDVTMELYELETLAEESEKLAANLIEGSVKFDLEGWKGLTITSQASGTPKSGAPS